MIDLQDAEITVETRFSIESYQNSGTRFYLRDYSTMEEFTTDCASWFDMETKPEYVYKEWSDIPDCLINESWLSPNFFELREALQSIDDSLVAFFWHWCKLFGCNPGEDDASQLVTDFSYATSGLPIATPEESQADDEEDEYYTFYDSSANPAEMFGEE